MISLRRKSATGFGGGTAVRNNTTKRNSVKTTGHSRSDVMWPNQHFLFALIPTVVRPRKRVTGLNTSSQTGSDFRMTTRK